MDTTIPGVFPRLGLQFDDAGQNLLPFQTSDELGSGGNGRHANQYLPLRVRGDDAGTLLLGNGTGGTNPIFYDTIGRNYRLGVRMNF